MKKLLVILGICGVVLACNSSDSSNENNGASDNNAASSSTAGEFDKGLELIAASDCTTCHAIDKKNIGPAYTDVAAKYDKNESNIEYLIDKIIQGGQGVWGEVPMTPHPDLSRDDAREMVNYIFSLK
jgi:cytochrome c